MKVFLTGATGFIGSQLVKRLLGDNHEVAILVRQHSDLSVLHDALPKINVHIHDGSYLSLYAALAQTQPDVVCHVASLFLAQHKPEDVTRLIESNLGMPTQLLEAMQQLGLRRLVNTGTSWQHFEDAAYNPVNLYAATKQAFEDLLAYYVSAHGFQAITLKLFDTYGPGDTRAKLFSLLRKTARSGVNLRMSPGEQLLDLVYIDDVLDAYLLAMHRLPAVSAAECYAVSNPERLTLKELVQVYGAVVGKDLQIEWGGLPYRPRETMQPCTHQPRLPGWQPHITLQQGIARMEADTLIDGLLVGQSK
ncbi:NAD(P)-dependent oxidoreductase [Janthinobacterium lividum]|nr:NAD(P)-dependent oxidoreductase [Janthinobacterium lividum]